MSQVPPSHDPFRSENTGVNPYATNVNTHGFVEDNSGLLTQLTIVGICIGVMSALTILFIIATIAMNAMGMNPQAQPPPEMNDAQRMGFYVGQYGALGIWTILQIAAIGGAVAMVIRRAYWLALIGSAASLVPLCGPCLGLSIPLGIWALVLLVRSDVRSVFA